MSGASSPRRAVVLAAALALSLTACSPAEKENVVKTNTQELSRLIRWPIAPLRVQWQVLEPANRSGLGPSDWQLAALLDFKPEDRARLLRDTAPAAINATFAAGFVLPWFPPPLKERFTVHPDGAVSLKDAPLDAVAFQSPPLSNGFFVPFGDEGRVLLYLYTR